MRQEAASEREDVEQLRGRFEEFRRTHAVRSRLPDELWAAAAKLARRDGIAATARARWPWTGRVFRGGRIDWSRVLL